MLNVLQLNFLIVDVSKAYNLISCIFQIKQIERNCRNMSRTSQEYVGKIMGTYREHYRGINHRNIIGTLKHHWNITEMPDMLGHHGHISHCIVF